MDRLRAVREYRYIVRLLLRNGKATLHDIQSIRRHYTNYSSSSSSVLHNLHVFLTSETEYNKLIRLYTPLNELSDSEKIARTANHVGLSVPPAQYTIK